MPILEHTGTRSLAMEAGEIVSVLGAPGTGKTRFAQELAFLSRPEEGQVLFHGQDPAARKTLLQPLPRPREVTLLVQNAEDQLFAKTVYDDVAFGPRRLMLSDDEMGTRVRGALHAVGLNPDEVQGRSPFALSGGERRRVALAGVLAMNPEVLILDEPTANLDPRTRNEFLTMLEPLRGKSAIIWLTTSAREAALADRVYLLKDGRTTEFPPHAQLLENWRLLADAGIELPPVYELARSLEIRGEQLPSVTSGSALQQAIVESWRSRHNDR